MYAYIDYEIRSSYILFYKNTYEQKIRLLESLFMVGKGWRIAKGYVEKRE